MPFALFNYSSLSYVIPALSSAVTNLPNKTLIFYDFQGPTIKLHDFRGLKNEILRALSIQPKIPVISVATSNGTDHFGLVRPEYSGPALKVVLFDRSGHFGRSDRNVPFHLTKLLLYPACKNNNQARGGLGRVCATGMYRSIEHVKFPKFQTGIFVEWKASINSMN